MCIKFIVMISRLFFYIFVVVVVSTVYYYVAVINGSGGVKLKNGVSLMLPFCSVK